MKRLRSVSVSLWVAVILVSMFTVSGQALTGVDVSVTADCGAGTCTQPTGNFDRVVDLDLSTASEVVARRVDDPWNPARMTVTSVATTNFREKVLVSNLEIAFRITSQYVEQSTRCKTTDLTYEVTAIHVDAAGTPHRQSVYRNSRTSYGCQDWSVRHGFGAADGPLSVTASLDPFNLPPGWETNRVDALELQVIVTAEADGATYDPFHPNKNGVEITIQQQEMKPSDTPCSDAPKCQIAGGSASSVPITVQDLVGGLSCRDLQFSCTNCTFAGPACGDRTTAPATVTATRLSSALPMSIDVNAADMNGNRTSCDYESTRADKDVPIFMYHYLAEQVPVPNPPWPGLDDYSITPEMFRRQMAVLKAYGYTVVSLAQYMDYREGRTTPPQHPVILTFDDGMKNVYDHARPILLNEDLRATMFVTTDWLAEENSSRVSRWLPNGEVMIWPEVATLYAEGFSIESHATAHDPYLTKVPEETVQQRLTDSRRVLQTHAGVAGNLARFFAYTNGAYDNGVQGCVREAGYSAGIAAGLNQPANIARSDIWALPRYNVNNSNSVDLDDIAPAQRDAKFFMRLLDPDFPIPDITIDGVEFLHQDDTPDSHFQPSETIKVKVKATNHGDQVTSRLALALDDDDDHGSPYYAGMTSVVLLSGLEKTVTFDVSLARSLRPGWHSYAARFLDEHAVLGYKASGWLPAFELDLLPDLEQVYLPIIVR